MLDLFSKRNQRKKVDEIIIYDELPEKLRNQIKFLIGDMLENYPECFELIHNIMCREHGKLSLSKKNRLGYRDADSILQTILNDEHIELIFDIIELTFQYKYRQLERIYSEVETNEIINDYHKILNTRFKESSVGYKMVNYKIIRIDSQATFTEIIEPTITLTYNKVFSNVNEEYVEAITSYQDEDYEKCLTKCLNSFESTIKIICDKKRWKYDDKDTSKKLLDICYENELIPPTIQSEFTSLRGLLESGIGPLRNNYSGHGKGSKKIVVEDYLAKYALNITGSCILFLIEISNKEE